MSAAKPLRRQYTRSGARSFDPKPEHYNEPKMKHFEAESIEARVSGFMASSIAKMEAAQNKKPRKQGRG